MSQKHIQDTYSVWITTNKISGSKTTLRFAQCTRRQQKKEECLKSMANSVYARYSFYLCSIHLEKKKVLKLYRHASQG